MFDLKTLKAFIKGGLTYIPGVMSLLNKSKEDTRHSCAQAGFCYTLWLSLLCFLKENEVKTNFFSVGEIGTGGSLGVAFCALLSGCEKFYALEVDQSFDKNLNLSLLDEIVLLFKNKASISSEYNQLNIKASSLDYPADIITQNFLSEEFINEIRNEILNGFENSKRIILIKNWEQQPSLNIDFIFSRAVMEHVSSPNDIYRAINPHLISNSYTLHDIELHSHGLSKKINGHYSISPLIWKIIHGKRPYFLNRWRTANHTDSITANNFVIVKTEENFRNVKEKEDNIPYGVVLLAKKKQRIV
jgi:hypothetical protein